MINLLWYSQNNQIHTSCAFFTFRGATFLKGISRITKGSLVNSVKGWMPVEGRKFISQSGTCKPSVKAQTQKLSKVMRAEGEYGAVPWRLELYLGILGNLVHTFSDFDVDVLSHPELRERGDCLELLLGPVEEVLIAMGKGFLLDLAGEGEVSRLKVDLRALGYLEEEKRQKC